MKWYYLNNDYLDKAVEITKVGSDDAIITSFDISDDHMMTYVSFYEPNQEGKNGSVWVIDTNSGKVLEQYDNVCYQPVKVMYKKK
jgi:Neuraminidase (sialidase)